MVVARASAWDAHDVEFEAKRVFAFRFAPVAPQRTFVYRKGIPLQEGYPPIFEYGVFEGECDSPNQRGRLSIPGTRTLGSRVRFANSVMTISLTRKHGVFDRECDSPRQGDRSRSRGEQGVYPCCRRLKPFHVPTIGMTILFCCCTSEMSKDETYRRKRDQPRT